MDYLAERFFTRKAFRPEPSGTNVLFAYYAQHFSHQFLRTDKARGPAFTSGTDSVDVSHIYGLDKATQDALRSFHNGKMKVNVINGEEFPPLLRDAPSVRMIYPPHTPENEKVLYAFSLTIQSNDLLVFQSGGARSSVVQHAARPLRYVDDLAA